MVISFIFLFHIIFIFYVFIKKWKSESLSSAFIDLVLIVIIFSVGWSLTTMISKLFWEPIGFGKHFDRDTISLFILTVGEFFFYKVYYRNSFSTLNEKGK